MVSFVWASFGGRAYGRIKHASLCERDRVVPVGDKREKVLRVFFLWYAFVLFLLRLCNIRVHNSLLGRAFVVMSILSTVVLHHHPTPSIDISIELAWGCHSTETHAM